MKWGRMEMNDEPGGVVAKSPTSQCQELISISLPIPCTLHHGKQFLVDDYFFFVQKHSLMS